MNMVEKIKAICKDRKIAISKLERDCGFANGYIRSLGKGKLPADRLDIVEKYLNVPHNVFIDAEYQKKDIKRLDATDVKDIELLNAYHSAPDDIKACICRILGIEMR